MSSGKKNFQEGKGLKKHECITIILVLPLLPTTVTAASTLSTSSSLYACGGLYKAFMIATPTLMMISQGSNITQFLTSGHRDL